MLAAYHGHADLVRFLLQHGADPNRLNDRRQSPLAGAVFKKEDDVIEVSGQTETRNPWAVVLSSIQVLLVTLAHKQTGSRRRRR